MGSQLLVSVRDADEAAVALNAGAGLIDVKDPFLGPLGKADDTLIRAVIDCVAGRVPVSAALGEWHEGHGCELPVDFLKWGPAGAGRRPAEWRTFMCSRASFSRPPEAGADIELAKMRLLPACTPAPAAGGRLNSRTVIVAYADWQCAEAPPVEEVVELACRHPGGVLLIDTHCKDAGAIGWSRRPNLLDWLTPGDLHHLITRCRLHDVRVALAGSLDRSAIEQLLPLEPDWFAVRGAACLDRERTAGICEQAVRGLVELLGRGKAGTSPAGPTSAKRHHCGAP